MPPQALICGTPETVIAAAAQWPRGCMQLRLFANFADLGGMGRAEFIDAAKYSLRQCSKVSGLTIELTDNEREADLRLAAERMRGGILAYCYFPSGSCNEQLQTRFNSAVRWTPELFADTLTHELGHGFGLPHTNDRRDIMYPTIIDGRELDAAFGPHYSIPELVRRYGRPTTTPPTPTPPTEPNPMPTLLQLLLQALIEIAKQIDWSQIIQMIIDSIGKDDDLRENLIAQLESTRK
jgi:hypothetical protein